MDTTKESVAEIIGIYKDDVQKLIKYLPWLEEHSGQDLTNYQKPEGSGEHAIKVPVYDSTLLSFIKVAQKTKFMNKNYVYSYSRKRMRTCADELRVIDSVSIMEMNVLGDILAKYVLEGMRKGTVWNLGLSSGVYAKCIGKMKELIEFWTRPM